MSEPALRASGLGKRFGRSAALRRRRFRAAGGREPRRARPQRRREIDAAAAARGAGAPDLGLAPRGRDAGPSSRARAAQVGFIGHASLLYPTLTARENLLFAARLHQVPDAARARGRAGSSGPASSRVADLPVGALLARHVAAARRSRAGWSTTRTCCCSTSPSRASMRAPRTGSPSSSPRCARPAARWCW